jgi:hypothetical protein
VALLFQPNRAAAGNIQQTTGEADQDSTVKSEEILGWINFGLTDYYVVACKVTFGDLANSVNDWLESGDGILKKRTL